MRAPHLLRYCLIVTTGTQYIGIIHGIMNLHLLWCTYGSGRLLFCIHLFLALELPPHNANANAKHDESTTAGAESSDEKHKYAG